MDWLRPTLGGRSLVMMVLFVSNFRLNVRYALQCEPWSLVILSLSLFYYRINQAKFNWTAHKNGFLTRQNDRLCGSQINRFNLVVRFFSFLSFILFMSSFLLCWKADYLFWSLKWLLLLLMLLVAVGQKEKKFSYNRIQFISSVALQHTT